MSDEPESSSFYEEFVRVVLDEVSPGEVITWEAFSSLGGIDIPSREDVAAWTLYVQYRNALKSNFNFYCQSNRLPYRLFVQDQGVSLILKEKEDMAMTEEVRIIRRLGGWIKNIRRDFNMLAKGEGLKKTTRASLRTMASAAFGLQLSLSGHLRYLGLPDENREELEAFLTPELSDDVESIEEE